MFTKLTSITIKQNSLVQLQPNCTDISSGKLYNIDNLDKYLDESDKFIDGPSVQSNVSCPFMFQKQQ